VPDTSMETTIEKITTVSLSEKVRPLKSAGTVFINKVVPMMW
jgi:hypothetical protein